MSSILDKLYEELSDIKDNLLKSEDKDVKIERALDQQGTKTVLPSEVHRELGDWWHQNKDRVLTDAQKQKLSDIQQVKSRRSEFKVVKGDEEVSFSENGQWDVKKSNYGPKGGGQYNPTDNIKRKEGNTGDVAGEGPNVNVKAYSSKPGQLSAKQQASIEHKGAKAKSGKVKSFKDMSVEEQAALRAQHETKPIDSMEKVDGSNWSYNRSTGNFNHPIHGAVKLKQLAGDNGGYHVVHNGRIVSEHEAGDKQGAMNSIKTHIQSLK